MRGRAISLSEDAYRALSALRRPDESFTDIVLRLARRRSLTDLSSAVDLKAAASIADAIRANRRDRLGHRRKGPGIA